MTSLTIYLICVAISWICLLIAHQYFSSDDYRRSYLFKANSTTEHILINFLIISISFLVPFTLISVVVLSPLGLVAYILNKFAKFAVKYIKMNYQRD